MLARSRPPFLRSLSWQSKQYSLMMDCTTDTGRFCSAALEPSALNRLSSEAKVQGMIGIRMVNPGSILFSLRRDSEGYLCSAENTNASQFVGAIESVGRT